MGNNLYDYREGHPDSSTTLSVNGAGVLTRIQVAPQGSHAAFRHQAIADRLRKLRPSGRSTRYEPATGPSNVCSCIPDGYRRLRRRKHCSGFFMSDDGRTFFSTTDPLVPQDTNEARRLRVRRRAAAADHDRHGPGTQQGQRKSLAGLMGVSPNGTDVYFSTFDTLVPRTRTERSSSSMTPGRAAASLRPDRRHRAKRPTSAMATAAPPAPPSSATIRSAPADLGPNGNCDQSRSEEEAAHAYTAHKRGRSGTTASTRTASPPRSARRPVNVS